MSAPLGIAAEFVTRPRYGMVGRGHPTEWWAERTLRNGGQRPPYGMGGGAHPTEWWEPILLFVDADVHFAELASG
jgi:hypothetical protein